MLDQSFREKEGYAVLEDSKHGRDRGTPANVHFADTFVGSVPIKHAAQRTSVFLTDVAMSQLGLLPTEDNVVLVANGLPALRHGFDTLPQVCMYIAMVCFNSAELKKFKTLASNAVSGGALATAAMLAMMLEYLNGVCERHHQNNARVKEPGAAALPPPPSLLCLCPNHFCPIFVMRLFSGTEVLSRVLGECFRANDARQILALRVAWRLFHIAQVCVNRCSRFRCLALKDEPRMAFWQQVQAELYKSPARETAFQCIVAIIVDRTEGDVDEEVDLFRSDIQNPLLIPLAFELLRGTSLDFQLKGVTAFFSGLLGQNSLISPVHDLAVCLDHQLAVLHLLSDLMIDDFKDVSLAGDVELTLVAYLLTLFMTYFDKSNFTPCMNHALAVINSWGPPTAGYRRVYLMRQVLFGLLSTVKRECGTIARDMGQNYTNFTDLATTVLQFCLYHGYPAPVSCGWSHFPHLADLLRESFLPAPDDELPKHWSATSGIRLHVCARRHNLVELSKAHGDDSEAPPTQWDLVVEDIDLLRKLEEIFRSLDLDPDMFRGPEDTKKLIRRGAQFHKLVLSLLGVFLSAKAQDPRVSLTATSYPQRRRDPKMRRQPSAESLTSMVSAEEPATPRSPGGDHNRTKSAFDPSETEPRGRVGGHHHRTVSDGVPSETETKSDTPPSSMFRSLPERSETRQKSRPERAVSPTRSRPDRFFDITTTSPVSVDRRVNPLRALSPSRSKPERAISPSRTSRTFSPERSSRRGAASPERIRAYSPLRRGGPAISACEEQCLAQNGQMSLVRSIITNLESAMSSPDGAVVTKHFLSKKMQFETYLNSCQIMEGSLLLSRMAHGVTYNGTSKFQLERDRIWYSLGDRKHSVPLVFIKAITLDNPYPDAKLDQTLYTFSVISKVDSFLAATPELEVRDTWVNLLSFSIARQRMEHRGQGDSLEGLPVLATGIFRGGPLASQAQPSLSRTLFGYRQIRVSIAKPAILRVQKTDLVPLYVADQKCAACDANVVFRKLQHCRRCGRGFCQKCISRLKGRRFQLSKVCLKCFEELEERADSNQQVKEQMSSQATFAPGTKAAIDLDLTDALQLVAARKQQLEQSLVRPDANKQQIEDELAQCQRELEELAQKQIQSLKEQ